MKTNNDALKDSDVRVWCEYCSIRVAPNEERITSRGKTYHQRCYSKFRDAASNGKIDSPRSKDNAGDEK
jgi:hypothetical protein